MRVRDDSIIGPGGIPWVVRYQRVPGFHNRWVFNVYVGGKHMFDVKRVSINPHIHESPWIAYVHGSEEEIATGNSRTKATRRAMQIIAPG